MSDWAMRRFWTETQVAPLADGFEVQLDGKRVKTPARAALILPTREMAEAVAAEWQEQDERIDPRRMPVTRAANAAIDRVRPQHDAVVDMLAAYGDSDLLCYRAETPAALVQRQRDGWDPLLDWAAQALDARLETRVGVMHAPQDATALARLRSEVAHLDAFELTGFHDLVALSGSLILALAVARGRLDAKTAWTLSRIDEDYQAEVWGVDEDAAAVSELKRGDMLRAKRFLDMARAGGRDAA